MAPAQTSPRPLLSVVIPTWNRARLVCEAAESALAQRPDGVEVIVVDDCSTDDTLAVLARRFGSRIRVIARTAQAGTSRARNLGARHARGELLAFLDSDDLWLPGKLDAELEVFERFPEADVVFSDNLFFVEGELQAHSRFGSAKNQLLAATRGRVRWLSECPAVWTRLSAVSTCSSTLRRRVVERLGDMLFAEDLRESEDWWLEIRMAERCRIAVLPKVLAHVRQFDDGTRPDRAAPGTTESDDQRRRFLRCKLLVLQRALGLRGFRPEIVAELDASRADAADELARFSASVKLGAYRAMLAKQGARQPRRAKQLIVNADDFGYSAGVNAGTLAAHARGIVTAATVMVLEPSAAEAIRAAIVHAPRMSLGLHLTVTGGGPPAAAAHALPTLAPEGRFRQRRQDLPTELPAGEIRLEFEAQIERFEALAGRMPSHLDSHHHAALHPSIAPVFAALAHELSLPVRAASAEAREQLRAKGVKTPDRLFTDFHGEGVHLETLERVLASVPEGVSELMCHPAQVDDELRLESSYSVERETELGLLCDAGIRERLDALGIELIGYDRL